MALVYGLLALALLGLAAAPAACAAEPLTVFVSPDGDDSWDGSRARPFATLERARDEVRARRAAGQAPAGVLVHLRGGVYLREHTFALTAEDAGRPGAPVEYRAWQGEQPRLIGGRPVTNFRPLSDQQVLARLPEPARAHVVEADLAELGVTDLGTLKRRGFAQPSRPAHLELFFQGRRMTLARWPNDEFARIAALPGPTHEDGHRGELGALENGFHYEGDRPARWREIEDIWVHGYWAWDWANSYERVASIDTERRLVKTEAPHGLYGFRVGHRFYFLNVLEELDQPGEFYVDRRRGRLYFWPPAPLAEGEAWVSTLEEPLISLEDCSHLTLRGLTLEYSRGHGVQVSGGEEVLIADCAIRNLGNWAVIARGGARHGVVGCDIFGVGDGGIELSGGDRATLTPAGHRAEDNRIWRFGEWSRCYYPAVSINGVGNRVAHNLMHDSPHSAILLGGNEHLIEFNEIHHVCLEAGDVGAFYMGRDWTQRGNVIRHNYFHDIADSGLHGSRGVYLDDCTSGAAVVGNLFVRVTRAVFVGGGRDNTVENNIFVDCAPAVEVDGRGLDPSPVWQNMVYRTMRERLEAMRHHEPPYRERYPELLALDRYYEREGGVPPEGNVIARNISVGGQWLNLVWHAQPEMMDIRDNLVDEDPRFVDAEGGDFRLRPDSPALALGFEPIPLERIGPRR